MKKLFRISEKDKSFNESTIEYHPEASYSFGNYKNMKCAVGTVNAQVNF